MTRPCPMKSPKAYERNATRRRLELERRLMGESLNAFHARETAKPPTLAELYDANHKNRERCTMTADLFNKPTKRGSNSDASN